MTHSIAPAAGLLAKYIENNRMSQADLARGIGLTPGTISKWISGKYRPDIESLFLLEDTYGIPAREWRKR